LEAGGRCSFRPSSWGKEKRGCRQKKKNFAEEEEKETLTTGKSLIEEKKKSERGLPIS